MLKNTQTIKTENLVLRNIIEEVLEERQQGSSFPHWGNWRNWGNWENWGNWVNWRNWWN